MRLVEVPGHVYRPLQEVLVFGVYNVHAVRVLVAVRVGPRDDVFRERLDVEAGGDLRLHVLQVLVAHVPVLVNIQFGQVRPVAVAPQVNTVTPLEGLPVEGVKDDYVQRIVLHYVAHVILGLGYVVGKVIA